MRINPVILAAMSIAFGVASVAANAQGSLADQLAVCARIGKKDARFECYESIARATSPAATASQTAPEPSRATPSLPAPAAAPPPAASAGFGAEQIARAVASARKAEGQDALSAVIVSSRDNGAGLWQFRLADGALWRTTERSSTFRPPAPNEAVTIRKGSLGSYLMDVGRQSGMRVERVR